MALLTDFIHVVDDSLGSDVCDFLVDLFDNNPNYQERVENNSKPNCFQMNLTSLRDLNETVNEVHNHLIRQTFEQRNQYYDFIDSRVFPESHAFEQFKIKKYSHESGDFYDTHVDVIDHETSRRFLCFYWFIGDSGSGGQIQFKDLKVEPKKGRLVVFPPHWMFPYKELKSKDNSKYNLTTYLHYR
jgi:prolyl 4-hydroxylase